MQPFVVVGVSYAGPIGPPPRGPLDGERGFGLRTIEPFRSVAADELRGLVRRRGNETVMTKKNAKKRAARARQGANGGKYENHLRNVGGIVNNAEPVGLFDAISREILKAHPDAKLNFVDADKRLAVHLGGIEFAVVTPHNVAPEWPVYVWNESLRGVGKDDPRLEGQDPEMVLHLRRLLRRRGYEWRCETVDDILTALRWPDVLPSGPFASVNEIHDNQENPSKHVWVRSPRARHPEPLTTTYECAGCDAHIYVRFQEDPDEVARVGFDNWRERQSPKSRRGSTTLTRTMGVAAITPQCPRNKSVAEDTTIGGIRFASNRPTPANTEIQIQNNGDGTVNVVGRVPGGPRVLLRNLRPDARNELVLPDEPFFRASQSH